jgi:hypothetical protein
MIHSLSTLITTPTLITVPGLDLSCTYMHSFHVPDVRHCPGMVPGTIYFHSYSISAHCIYTRTTYNKTHLAFPHSTELSLHLLLSSSPSPSHSLRLALASAHCPRLRLSSFARSYPFVLCGRSVTSHGTSLFVPLAFLSPPPSLCCLPI